jgi:hypothetical protein
MSDCRRILPLCAVALLAICMPATAAGALEIPPGGITLQVLNAAGEAENRAGAHPSRLVQGFEFSQTTAAAEDLKDIEIDFSAGLSGDPKAVPPCPRRVFAEAPFNDSRCPDESQIGMLIFGSEEFPRRYPLFSVEPGPNEAVVFGAVPFVPIKFIARLRPDDQGLSLRLSDIAQSALVSLDQGQIELWGVPADHQEGTSIPRRPLLSTPTRCDGNPVTVTVSTHTWQRPDRWISGSGDTGRAPGACAELPFEPRVGFSLGTPVADAPTGASVDLTIPQSDDPEGRVSSQVKGVGVVLPEGVAIAPTAADGLGLCTDAQLGLGTLAEPACPSSSRVGSVEVTTRQLSGPLTGSIYLGEERGGERFRLFVVAGGMGSEMKMVGALRPDRASGRLTAIFDDLPQVSFERIMLHFDGGSRGLLATPLTCGPAAATARLAPYSGTAPVERVAAFNIAASAAAPCGRPAPFKPEFTAGSTIVAAGRPTSFTATVRRGDGEQLPERLEIALPPGVSAALGTVDPCPAAAVAAAGACPRGSRIGHVVAELGPGAAPARLGGEAYLTGAYRHAPFGLALVFKAAVGPFDLGTLLVRGGLRVDSLSGQITVAIDRLPTIFEGIPVRFRTIGLDVDRPGFLRNPTSCSPGRVSATLRSVDGAGARLSSRFRVRNCIDLPFRPNFSIGLTGGAELRRGGKPGLRISARQPARSANLRMAGISLPRLLKFDPTGLSEICARGQALAGNCPRGSRIGSGYARTSLLDRPLKGGVYLVQPRGSGSPDLWTAVEADGLRVDLRAETAIENGRVQTRLVGLPDFPMTSFAMRLAGGKHGIFELRESPCGERARELGVPLTVRGQNGARHGSRAGLAVPVDCGSDG